MRHFMKKKSMGLYFFRVYIISASPTAHIYLFAKTNITKPIIALITHIIKGTDDTKSLSITMHLHFLILLLTGFALSAPCFQQCLAPTLSSINAVTTASAISPSLQPIDEIDGQIQEVAGKHTAVALSNRSVPDPIRYPMCKRYLNVSLPSFCSSFLFISLVFLGGKRRA